jgi:hypothetical protein
VGRYSSYTTTPSDKTCTAQPAILPSPAHASQLILDQRLFRYHSGQRRLYYPPMGEAFPTSNEHCEGSGVTTKASCHPDVQLYNLLHLIDLSVVVFRFDFGFGAIGARETQLERMTRAPSSSILRKPSLTEECTEGIFYCISLKELLCVIHRRRVDPSTPRKFLLLLKVNRL